MSRQDVELSEGGPVQMNRVPMTPSTVRSIFRVVAVAEAITWAGLLLGMLFKYVLADDERGVQVFGPLHGAMFLAYLAAVLLARSTFAWSHRVTLAAVVCSVPPFASLLFEAWAEKTGHLSYSGGAGAARDEALAEAQQGS